jgi:hypothetical protein
MAKIETLNLNEDIHQYDDNVVDSEMRNLVEVSGLVVSSISTPLGSRAPNALKSIEALSNSDVETKIAWEVLKAQLTLNQGWVPSHKLSFLWYFFMVNDGKKPNPMSTQTMCCLVYQICSANSTTKK